MTINIKLIDNWRIRSDKNNVILLQEKDGREFAEGYYSSLEGALQSFVEKKIKLSNATSIFGLMNYLKTLTAGLNRVLQPLKFKLVPLNEVKK